MRTTLEIDDDVLAIAKQLAHDQRTSVGQVISKAARQSLLTGQAPRVRNGVPLFVPKIGIGRKPDLDLVNELRDQE
ncbi:MAG: CopG family transcriptional regulator [Bryobacterales bacterium]|nr:CopG family transcriptional regulator [Bryobacterales bacterium]